MPLKVNAAHAELDGHLPYKTSLQEPAQLHFGPVGVSMSVSIVACIEQDAVISNLELTVAWITVA